MMTLYIGDKNLSSWSLRPWLVMKTLGMPFEERMIRLDRPDTVAKVKAVSPGGTVPVLVDGDVVVWESLAICEYLAERFPDAAAWPKAPAARAIARAVAAEMHAGFPDLRRELSMNITACRPGRAISRAAQDDIDRIVAIWEGLRAAHAADGPFLFGGFTIADGFFAPVATRFRTYAVDLPPASQAYVGAIFSLPAMREWVAAAEREVEEG